MQTSLRLPEKPGVRAAIFLASASLSNSASSFSGLRWTLNIEALPLISGGPVIIIHYIKMIKTGCVYILSMFQQYYRQDKMCI